MNASDPVIKVVAHEFTHSLQSKAMYDRFKKFVFGVLEGEGRNRRTILDDKKNSASVYKNYDDTRLEFEVVASFVEERLLTDERVMREVVRTEGKAYGTRLHDMLNSIITKIKALLPWSNKSAVKQYEMLEEGRKMLAGVIRSEGVGESGEGYSVAKNFKDKNGNVYDSLVILDTDIFNGVSAREWWKKLKKHLEKRISRDTTIMPVFDEKGNKQILQFAKSNERVNNHPVNGELYMSKDNVSKLSVVHIDEIIEVSKEKTPYFSDSQGHGWLDEKGWLHRKAYVANTKNGGIYEISIDIAKTRDGRTILYSLSGKTKRIGDAEVSSLVKQAALSKNSYSVSSISNPDENVKQKQLEIINATNPAPDSYHTWVRSVEDIMTFEEAVADEEYADYDTFIPDYTREMANTALESGEITVYSSYPIENGVFVTPSAMEALGYSGNGKIYSKKVKLSDVAWIDVTQGQYAKADVDYDSNVKKRDMEFSVSTRADGKDGEISIKDVEAIRSIPRKSINEFSSEEIAKTEKWARKFYKELGTKSPFFRAWFGDWREHDVSEYNYITATNTEGKNPRGTFTNADTGWNITSSSVGYDETISHSGKDKLSLRAMQNIDKIIENSVLLDTEVSEHGRGKKSVYTAFMHKFYSVIAIDGKMHIAKMSVDESYQPGSDDTNKKFYHVRAIKIEEVPSVGIGKSHTPIMEGTPSINSISDLFSLVKQYDSEFKPKPVHKALLNEDGTPKVLYHGTEAKRIRKFKSAINWFSVAKRYAEAFGEKTYSVYLNIKNPLYVGYIDGKIDEDSISRLSKNTGIFAETLDEISTELNAKYVYEITNSSQFKKIVEKKGYDGLEAVEGGLTSFATFYPTQIKSATGNIGTFDGENADIYFSFSTHEDGESGETKLMPNGEAAPTYEEMHMAPVASAEKMLRGGVKFSEVVKDTGLSLREIALDMESRGENADSIRNLTGLYRDNVGGWQFDSAWLEKNAGDLNANREAKIAAAKSAFVNVAVNLFLYKKPMVFYCRL